MKMGKTEKYERLVKYNKVPKVPKIEDYYYFFLSIFHFLHRFLDFFIKWNAYFMVLATFPDVFIFIF